MRPTESLAAKQVYHVSICWLNIACNSLNIYSNYAAFSRLFNPFGNFNQRFKGHKNGKCFQTGLCRQKQGCGIGFESVEIIVYICMRGLLSLTHEFI